MGPATPSRQSAKTLAMWGLALVSVATLFPFNFSFDEQVNVGDEFLHGGAMKARGNDLLIGVDAAFGQAFKGRIGELRIYRDALTPAQVADEAGRTPESQRAMQGLAASYSFTEPSREVLRDDSGNDNHGTLVGGPRWIKEEGRRALSFDGSGQYVHVPNKPSIDIGGRSITISMRVVLEDSPADGVVVAKPWWSGIMAPPYYQYAVEFGKLERSIDFYFADTRGRARGPFSVHPPMGAWTHIIFVYDGAVRGYVDGREILVASLQPWRFSDIVLNLLLFVPLGFGLAAVGQSKGMSPGTALPLIVALGTALSFGVEILQCWLPDREPSWIDVGTNSLSSAFGAGLHLAAGSKVIERLKRVLLD